MQLELDVLEDGDSSDRGRQPFNECSQQGTMALNYWRKVEISGIWSTTFCTINFHLYSLLSSSDLKRKTS